jgi:hypothetical protein
MLIVLCAVTAGSGKSTKMVMSWKNPEYSGKPFKKVLLIGMSANSARRDDFEDALSQALAKPGLEVISGNSLLLRPGSKLDLDYLRMQIRENKIDGVVLSRLVSVKTDYSYFPGAAYFDPYYRSFYGYYSTLYPVVYSPGYLVADTKVRIETNIYATTPPDGELVWTGTSDTVDPNSAAKVIKSVVKLLTVELSAGNVL